jgi:hypothetical protein
MLLNLVQLHLGQNPKGQVLIPRMGTPLASHEAGLHGAATVAAETLTLNLFAISCGGLAECPADAVPPRSCQEDIDLAGLQPGDYVADNAADASILPFENESYFSNGGIHGMDIRPFGS